MRSTVRALPCLTLVALALALQPRMQGQTVECAIQPPLEGQEQISGTAAPEEKKVKVSVSNPETRKQAFFEVVISLSGDKFSVPVPPLQLGQIINVQVGNIPNACSAIVARGVAHKVYHSLMDPKNVSDIFGKRIGKRFVAIQVTITNPSKEFQYIIHDVSLDVSRVRKGAEKQWAEGGKAGQLSSRELSIMRGVAEKGQVLDFRNLLLRIFKGVGTVAAGALAVPVLGVGGSWAEAVALHNGPFLTAYAETLPDFSISQLVRLNDSAYVASSVIPRQQSRVVVAFIPQRLFMDKNHRKKFWKEPTSVLNEGIDFRKIHVIVDGEHVVNVADIAPVVVGAIIEPNEMKKFAAADSEVRGYIVGRFLAGATITIEQPAGLTGRLSVDLDGTPTDRRINFIVKSEQQVTSGTILEFRVAKGGDVRSVKIPVQYSSEQKPSDTLRG